MPDQNNERDAFLSLLGEDALSPEWQDYFSRLSGSCEHNRLADVIRVVRGEADAETRTNLLEHNQKCDHCKDWFDAYEQGWQEQREAEKVIAAPDSWVAEVSRDLKAKLPAALPKSRPRQNGISQMSSKVRDAVSALGNLTQRIQKDADESLLKRLQGLPLLDEALHDLGIGREYVKNFLAFYAIAEVHPAPMDNGWEKLAMRLREFAAAHLGRSDVRFGVDNLDITLERCVVKRAVVKLLGDRGTQLDISSLEGYEVLESPDDGSDPAAFLVLRQQETTRLRKRIYDIKASLVL
jgi:hypothetical protein